MGWLVIWYLVFAGLLTGLALLGWSAARRRHRFDPNPIAHLSTVIRERAEHRRNVQALRHQHGIPIERLARDLRRLRRIIANEAGSSAAHQLGNRIAYDRLLIQCCSMLEVEHELDQDTGGHDRDIERLRVEAELERAGLVLSKRYGQAA